MPNTQPSPIAAAFKLSLPTLACYFPLGVVFGLIFTQQGYPWFLAPVFSFCVYGGAIQFLALTLIASGGSLISIALAVFPLGLRNIFYGIPLLKRYKKAPLFLRLYLAATLVDSTFSLLMTGPKFEGKKDLYYLTFLTFFVQIYWVLGTVVGTFIEKICTLPKGLEFSLTAFFMAIGVEQLRKTKDARPLMIGAFSFGLAVWLIPNYPFLGGVAGATLFCLFLPERREARA